MHNAAKALSVETIHCLASALWDEIHFQSGKGRRRTAIFHSTDALVPDDANIVESFSRSENTRMSMGFTSSHTCVEIRRQREILFPSETDLKFSYNCLLFLASGKVAVRGPRSSALHRKFRYTLHLATTSFLMATRPAFPSSWTSSRY